MYLCVCVRPCVPEEHGSDQRFQQELASWVTHTILSRPGVGPRVGLGGLSEPLGPGPGPGPGSGSRPEGGLAPHTASYGGRVSMEALRRPLWSLVLCTCWCWLGLWALLSSRALSSIGQEPVSE